MDHVDDDDNDDDDDDDDVAGDDTRICKASEEATVALRFAI